MTSLDPTTLVALDEALDGGLIDLPEAVLLFVEAVTKRAAQLHRDMRAERLLMLAPWGAATDTLCTAACSDRAL